MTQVRKKPSLDFSLTGLVYSCMMLFMLLAAISSQANLLFAVFGLMAGVLLVSWALSRVILRGVEIRRILPERLSVGQPATIQYEFHNRKRFWPSFSVTIGEISGAEAFAKQPQAYLLHAAARTRAMAAIQVLPRRRGLYQLDRFQLSTSFPFGFVKRAIERRQKEGIVIYPAIGVVDRRLLARCLSAELSGARMKPRRGGSDEFYGIREFQQGENPRWIYWRRSARTGELVAKEMTRIAPPRIMLLIDTYVSERTREQQALVERGISMAGSMVAQAIEQGLAIGLHAWSGQWLTIAPSRGKRHGRDLMTALSRLPLNTVADCTQLIAEARPRLRPGMTPVLVSPQAVEGALLEHTSQEWVVLPARPEDSRRWFRFPEDVDFACAMPADQDPGP